MKIIYGYLFTALLLFNSCESSNDEGEEPETNCDFVTLVSAEEYASAESDDFDLISTEIIEDCLEITFRGGGCSGDTWEMRLIDSEQILESFPIQRNLIFELKDEEECEALITKIVSFDISELKVENGEVILNITNTQSSLSYIN